MRNEANLPPFQIVAAANKLFHPDELSGIIASNEDKLQEGELGAGGSNKIIRRSQIRFLKPETENLWLFERLWWATQNLNERYFCVDIEGIQGNVQLTRYDATDHGFYDWHTDFSDMAPNRKLSLVLQLSDPADYGGGELELAFRGETCPVDKAPGTLIAFPSFVLHRVTPVTRGTRWSLVAWIGGPRWR